ncbi:hypothetical protein BH10PSE7_BH10PSE7_21080 [soil metagenome]
MSGQTVTAGLIEGLSVDALYVSPPDSALLHLYDSEDTPADLTAADSSLASQTSGDTPAGSLVPESGAPVHPADVAINIDNTALPASGVADVPAADSPAAALDASDTLPDDGARLASDGIGGHTDMAIAIIDSNGISPDVIDWLPILDPLPPTDPSDGDIGSGDESGDGGDSGSDDGSVSDDPGDAPYDYSGYWADSAGDVNGDGFDDTIISTYAYANGINSSSAYVVFGTAGGAAPPLDPAMLDGSNGFRINDGGTSNYGPSVTAAGDVNGDGFADLIVATNGADGSTSSFVVFGSASGSGGEVKTSGLDGSNGFRIVDTAADNATSLWVSAAGDVNNDGFADIAVEAYGTDADGNWTDSSYIVFGTAGGFNGAIDIAALDGTNGYKVESNDQPDEGDDGTIGVLDPPISIWPICVIYAGDEPIDDGAAIKPALVSLTGDDFLA